MQRRRFARQAEAEQRGGEQKGQQGRDLADTRHAMLQGLCRELDQQRGGEWQRRQQQDEAVHQQMPRDEDAGVSAFILQASEHRQSEGL